MFIMRGGCRALRTRWKAIISWPIQEAEVLWPGNVIGQNDRRPRLGPGALFALPVDEPKKNHASHSDQQQQHDRHLCLLL
jgi:hypothetical protein